VAERIAEIVVLAEDLNHVNFARQFLQRKGHHPRTIRVVPVPGGRGSGEQYVREHYPEEVSYYRNRSTRRRAALVVVIDADAKSVVGRERELQTGLVHTGGVLRESHEAIVLLIPKRHIETWIYCLLGEHVDELTDYTPRRGVHEEIKTAAVTFYEWSRPHYAVPDHCVESLGRGLAEVHRIP
jgi:hypothetical protein